jgi:hypothetical protein
VHCAWTSKQQQTSSGDSAGPNPNAANIAPLTSAADMTSSSSMAQGQRDGSGANATAVPLVSITASLAPNTTTTTNNSNSNSNSNATAGMTPPLAVPMPSLTPNARESVEKSSASGNSHESQRVVAIKLFHVVNKENASAQETASAYQDFMNEIVLQGAAQHDAILSVEGTDGGWMRRDGCLDLLFLFISYFFFGFFFLFPFRFLSGLVSAGFLFLLLFLLRFRFWLQHFIFRFSVFGFFSRLRFR